MHRLHSFLAFMFSFFLGVDNESIDLELANRATQPAQAIGPECINGLDGPAQIYKGLSFF